MPPDAPPPDCRGADGASAGVGGVELRPLALRLQALGCYVGHKKLHRSYLECG